MSLYIIFIFIIFIDIYTTFLTIYNLALCMFLFKGTCLIYTVDSLTLILMSNSTITHSWMKLTYHLYFFCKAHQSFLHFGTLKSTSALCFGAILKSKITNKTYKNVENLSLNRQQKRILVHSVRADKKAEQPVLSLTCWVCVGWFRSHCCVHACMSTSRMCWMLISGLQIHCIRWICRNEVFRVMRINYILIYW